MKHIAAIAVGLASVSASANIIRNGSFETPVAGVADGIASIYAPGVSTYRGGSQFDGWVVGGDSVDILASSIITPPNGSQSLELNGLGPGYIYQDLNTVPGTQYSLAFAMAVNALPEWGWDGSVRVSFGGVQTQTFNLAATPTIQWTEQSVVFTATESITRLVFESLNQVRDFGPLLDNIRLTGDGSAVWPAVGPFPTYSPLVPGYVPNVPTTPDAGNALFLLGCAVAGVLGARRVGI